MEEEMVKIASNELLVIRVRDATDDEWMRLRAEWSKHQKSNINPVVFVRGDRVQFQSAQVPIPVAEQLPEIEHPGGPYARSDTVLAYVKGDGWQGWCSACYVCTEKGHSYWQASGEGVSGYEFDLEEYEHVTHWMPYPSAPQEPVI